jgi:hypothetical protein
MQTSTGTDRRRGVLRSEQGAMLIHVALALIALMAFNALVVDYGIKWVSRRQAQNAADAGALAGGIARAFDEIANPPAAGGVAAQSATLTAQANNVWMQAPAVNVTWNCPVGVAGRCVRVDIFRDGTNGSTPLPTFFGRLVGVNSQGTRATATARVAFGNATDCMRPWGVADRWDHRVPPLDRYDRWYKQGNTVQEYVPHDIYVAPGPGTTGTGYTVTAHRGTQLILKNGNPNSDSEAIIPGWFLPLRLPDGAGSYDSGANPYRANIRTCVGQPVRIGDYLPTEDGNMVGPTGQGVDDLIAQDPNAKWDAGNQAVVGSCAPGCAPFSPRIVPLPVFDVDDFQYRRAANNWSVCPTGGKCVRVVNILGFYVSHQLPGGDVVGYLLTYPGNFVQGAPSVGDDASFLVNVHLIR